MRRSVYRDLMASLLGDCRTGVTEFADSHHNHEVFAFAIECDPFHGSLTFGLNTEKGHKDVLQQRYPKAKPVDIMGLHGIRFRVQDFAFNDFGLSEETMVLLDEIAAAQHDAKTDRTAERHADMLMLTLARVVLALGPDFAPLDLTDDFISFAVETEASERTNIPLMRRTIPDDLFDKVFPEVRAFNEKLAGIALLSLPKQAEFWANNAYGHATGADNLDVRRFQLMGMSLDELMNKVVEIGSPAVGPLVDILDKSARQPQLNKPRSKAAEGQGPTTPTCDFALRCIDAIAAVRLVDEHNVARIQALLTSLHKRDTGKKAGPVAPRLATLLNHLRPQSFPEPKVDKSNNLRNAADFFAAK